MEKEVAIKIIRNKKRWVWIWMKSYCYQGLCNPFCFASASGSYKLEVIWSILQKVVSYGLTSASKPELIKWCVEHTQSSAAKKLLKEIISSFYHLMVLFFVAISCCCFQFLPQIFVSIYSDINFGRVTIHKQIQWNILCEWTCSPIPE